MKIIILLIKNGSGYVKKYLLMLLVLFMTLGCNNRNNKELTLKEKISMKYDYYKRISCTTITDDIMDMQSDLIVTKHNAFEINFDRIFSNNENCKEIEIPNLDSEIILAGGWGVITKNYKYGIGKHNYKLDNYDYKYFSELGNNIIYHDSSWTKGYTFVSIDNEFKLIKLTYGEDGNMFVNPREKKIEYDFKDEIIINISDRFIKTDKAFYVIKKYITNKNDCEKYADIECKYDYKIEKDDVLTENYNDILYAGNEYIIDKNYDVYYYKKRK